MRHFKKKKKKVEDEDFPMIGLHSQRNEDYSGVYDHLLEKNSKNVEINNALDIRKADR